MTGQPTNSYYPGSKFQFYNYLYPQIRTSAPHFRFVPSYQRNINFEQDLFSTLTSMKAHENRTQMHGAKYRGEQKFSFRFGTINMTITLCWGSGSPFKVSEYRDQ
ncbi:hypothetical protein PROFUN_05340 [Planoprotostelium fungivorum]|uniref:Uncharacterized protein n=1 Tax=Planoprotostelium fungivorum TaxID=1890364 RepID=A0A2P6NR35_9EUKA|nr:hypothetical protein PROFUN_05340 [Planoprotostelium fungivorum]